MRKVTLQASWCKHTLNFKFKAGTSRGSMLHKNSYFLKLWDKSNPDIFGIGESGPLSGLSNEFETIEAELADLVKSINSTEEITHRKFSSSLTFAIEMALKGLNNKDYRKIYDTAFFAQKQRIPINGLIWMGDKAFMQKQISQKLEEGFTTIKLKIGAIDFETELEIIKKLRKSFKSEDLTIRVDANGAFQFTKAQEVLEKLSEQRVHSIEQPIKAGNWEMMHALCETTPTPIALDEELIGIANKLELLEAIKPQYIILKPSLHGGFESTKNWIELAKSMKIDWWITSALESNIGLNAICQFTSLYDNKLPQGLGTGKLYHNNISSPLHIEAGFIDYNGKEEWDLSQLKF